MSVFDYVRSLQCLDFVTFKNLVADNCDVTYVFNGVMGTCTGSEFVERLKKGHFENTIKCEVLRMTIEKIETPQNCPPEALVYSIGDSTIYDRLGFGRDESGPGKYDMISEGVVTFLNGKVVRMIYSFVKVHYADDTNFMDVIGGANEVTDALDISALNLK